MGGAENIGKLLSGTLSKKHDNDAGLDIQSNMNCVIEPRSSKVISTGLRIAIPDGCVGLVWSRSGLSVKHKIEVGAGCIDVGYTGEVMVHLYNHSDEKFTINSGDRIAQLLTIPVNLNRYVKVEQLDSTNRGENGFGSSGV